MKGLYAKELNTSTLINTKQAEDESVKCFLARLKVNLIEAGFVNKSSNKSEKTLISYFVHGLRPEISKRLSATFPQTIQVALDSAIQLENKLYVTHSERRNKKESLYTIQTEEGDPKTFKLVLDKLNALASQLTTRMNNRDQEIRQALTNLESLASIYSIKNDPGKEKSSARQTVCHNRNQNRNGGQSSYQYRGI